MCNCGSKRTSFEQQTAFQNNPVFSKQHQLKGTNVKFQYTGKTGLSVTGAVTGKRYRFNFTGDVQLADYRDARSMAGISVLKVLDI